MVSAEAKKFMTPSSFGRGTFMGDDPSILSVENPIDRLYISAWHHACVDPDAVVKIYGEKWTRKRYDNCDFVTKTLWEHVETIQGKSKLYKQLTTSKKRLWFEGAGLRAPDHTPNVHRSEISPLSSLVGYALPRVFIEIAGLGEQRTADKYFRALDLFDQAVKKTNQPTKLLALFSESALKEGVNPRTLFSHILPEGVLREENNKGEYADVIYSLKNTEFLWGVYEQFSIEDKKQAEILSFNEHHLWFWNLPIGA